ncbi:MAG: hypothetical protein KKE41_03620, partial [Gammaproteobacteria bacterium]|nr:hypothetical protein [Gammaproteobacteria bacterium]
MTGWRRRSTAGSRAWGAAAHRRCPATHWWPCFVLRDDGQADIYLPSNEMRAVLHKDRVKARVVRNDRKGRPEGRVVEIVERPPQPI